MYHRCYKTLKVSDAVAIGVDICFVKCKISDEKAYQTSRHWFTELHNKDLLPVLGNAIAVYRAAREHPQQMEELLNSTEATVVTSGQLRIAYIFKAASAPTQYLLEPRQAIGMTEDGAGGAWRTLHLEDALLTVSVALAGSGEEGTSVEKLTRPLDISINKQPTISTYFKSTAADDKNS